MKTKKRDRVIALLLSCAMLFGSVYSGEYHSYADTNEDIVEENVTENIEKVSEEKDITPTEEVSEVVGGVSVTEEPTPTVEVNPTVTEIPTVEPEVPTVEAVVTEGASQDVTVTPTVDVVSPTNEPTAEPTKGSDSKVTVTATPTVEPTVTKGVSPTVTKGVSPTVVVEEGVDVVSADSLDEFAENLEDSMFDSKQLIVLSNTAGFENYNAVEIQNYDNIYVLSYESNSATRSAYSKIKADRVVLSVEINEVLKVNTESTSTEATNETTTEETELGKYLETLKATKEIRVAVLDTGLSTANFKGSYEDLGIDYTSEKATSLYDDNGHGTEMANLIVENSNSLVKVVPIKVADSKGKASVLNTYLAIQKAIESGVDVINVSMSASASAVSSVLTEAIDEANTKGIVVVVSAGNMGVSVENISPANVSSAVVVSAVNSDNSFASYSNYGSTVDYSSYGSYNGKTGTSYATARVSGLISDLLSKGGNVTTLDKYAIDLGTTGYDTSFGKGLLALETIKSSSEEDEDNKIAEENKAKFESLCKNWKGMTDEELNTSLESLSETIRGYFLKKLSASDLEEILKRNTILVKPLNMTKAVIVDSVEDIPTEVTESPAVKSYDMAYKYYLELAEDLKTDDVGRQWTNSGEFKFNFSESEDTTYNGTITVKLTNVFFSKAGSSADSNTILSAGDNMNVSWTGSVTGFVLGTPYLIKQKSSSTEWAGIYLVGMGFVTPKYHKVSKVYAVNTETNYKSRFGFFSWRSDALGDDVSGEFVGKVRDENTTVSTYFQANAYNIGLDTISGTYNATMNIVFNRPTFKVTYHRNRNSSDTKTYTVSDIKYGDTHSLIKNSSKSKFTKTGCTFKGWTVGTNTTVRQAGYDITVKSARNVYAQWSTDEYIVSYDLNGGSGKFNDQSKIHGVDLTLHSGTPTKLGYDFNGWVSSSDSKTYKAGGTYSKNADTTMKAKWKAKSYNVTVRYFRRDNSTASWVSMGSAVVVPVAYGSTFDASTYQSAGYTEVNKNKSSGIASYNYSNTGYKSASMTTYATLSGKLTMPAENVEVHLEYLGAAVTQPPTATPIPSYNLTVNPNGGTLVKPDGTETSGTWSKKFIEGEHSYFCTGSAYFADTGWNVCSLPVREGCTFNGWSVSPSSAVVDQCLFNPWWDYHANYKGDVTVTAKWNTDITYEYYTEDVESGEWKFMNLSETSTLGVNSDILLTDVENKAVANTPAGYEPYINTLGSVDGADLSSACVDGKYTLTGSTTVCILYTPKELNLTINVKGGTYKTAAGASRDNFKTTFTYGVEEEFSSKDINTYVSGGMSLPTKTGYHLCDPSNEYDVKYAEAYGFSPEPWSLVDGATGEILSADTYSYDGLSTVDVTAQANWVPNIVNLFINPNGGVLYGYDYNTDTIKGWSTDIFTKKYEMNSTYQFASTGGYTADPNSSVCFGSTHYGLGGADNGVADIPHRNGYTFSGWVSSNGGTIEEKQNTGDCVRNWTYTKLSDDTSDIYLTAQWTPVQYKITVDPDGGSFFTPDSQTTLVSTPWSKSFTYDTAVCFAHDYKPACDTNLNAVSQPTKKGHRFTGWNITSGGGTRTLNGIYWYFDGKYAGDVTVTAQWEKYESTLQVNPNGGNWNGYTTTQTYTGKYNETKNIPDPTISNYTATFNANGGTCTTTSKTTNRVFSSWSVSNGTNPGGTLSNRVFTYGEHDGGSTSLTALWSGSYKITLPSPSRTGYTFNGWYTLPSGGTRVGGAGDTVTISANKTYYAQWTPITYKLTVNPNGGSMYNGDTFSSNVFTTNAVYARKTYLGNLNSTGNYYSNYTYGYPSKTGHTFLDWKYSNGTGGLALAGEAFFSDTSKVTATKEYAYNGDYAGDVTATAQYRIHKSTLNVDPNTGTWKGSPNVQSFTQDYNTTLSIPDPTKPNYTATFDATGGTCTSSIKTTVAFNGWDISAINTAGTLNASSKVFTFGPTDGGKGTIKATWKGSYSITLPTPTRPGWDFLGWYTSATGGTKVGNAGATVTLSSDKTYYAQWTPHPTKITLSNTVDKTKVAFAKGNPVAVFLVTGKDVSGKSHTFIKTLKWDTNSSNYQSLSFTILSGTYTVTLLNQNEYSVGTPSGTSNVTVSGVVATANMSNGSESTVNFTTSEKDYSKYTGNSLVTTSLK